MKYQVYNSKAEKIKEVDLNPAIFEVEVNEGLVHQAAVAQMANRRKPLAHTKDRGEVRGGGKKPWRQKGTGRARHGSSRSPIWIGGGVTFGPSKNRNFKQKINKKMKRKALFICLSDRAKDQSMVLLDQLNIQESKTKEFVELVKNLKDVLKLVAIPKKKTITKDKKKADAAKRESKENKKFDIKNFKTSILVVVDKEVAKVSRIARNIPGVKVLSVGSLNVVDVLAHKNLLLTEKSLDEIEKIYLKK